MSTQFLIYCERLDPGMWAEPANLVSNVGFLVAGIWALARCRRLGIGFRGWDLWGAALLIVVIGIGSALWHSLHTSWAKEFDVVPILLFIHLYIYSFLRRQVLLTITVSVIVVTLFFAASRLFAASTSPHLLHGSIFYLPAMLALGTLAVWSFTAGAATWRLMALATLLFTASLLFRTIDGEVCTWLPTGTHFIWHLLNALVLSMLFRVLSTARGSDTKNPSRSRRAGVYFDSKPLPPGTMASTTPSSRAGESHRTSLPGPG
ncbi:MAG: ceramidase domain-containing protein [Arenicellales bacterium]